MVQVLCNGGIITKMLDTYHICCGRYDADGKSENKGHATSKEESPPRNLNLVFHEDTKQKRNCYSQPKKEVEPP